MPPICHLFPSEPHRNLIGTSPNNEPIIALLSLWLKQLTFDIIIQPRRPGRLAFRIGHALMPACFPQGSTVFLCPPAHLPSYFLKYTRTRGGSYRFSWAAGQLGSKITFFRIKTCIYPQKVVLLWHNCYYSPHKMMWIRYSRTMEHKSCPRCGAAFICQHENPAKCQCAGVELSPAARAHLAEHYPNQCLCRKCLLEFAI